MDRYLPQRKHPRLNHFDYSTSGAYFITICTHNRSCLLSNITEQGLIYTTYGNIAREQLILLERRYSGLKVDQYVIMPNHIHMILLLEQGGPRITDVVCAYKSLTTRECKKIRPIDILFQTSFYEHVIRGQVDYDEIAEYIVNNPKQWELDQLYSQTQNGEG